MQVILDKETVVPPTAEAAQLGKFGEHAVNTYTGVPNIQVPIYAIQGHDISLQVGLSYNSTGNKTAEGASWVGVGWNLNAGGVISRVVLGELDENVNYYNKAQEIEDGLIAPNPSLTIDEYEFLYDVAKGEIESQPDQFYASFGGRNIKFYISPRKRIYIKEYADLRISATYTTGGDINTISIVDEKGTTYVFSEQEETELKYDERTGPDARLIRPPKIKTYNSAWHLTSMTSRDLEEVISFS